MFMCMLGCYIPSTLLSVPKLSEGADRVGGQLRGDKECPFSGVTNSGTFWWKMQERDAPSVTYSLSLQWEVPNGAAEKRRRHMNKDSPTHMTRSKERTCTQV